jgi:hypothetical protein
VLRVSAAKEYDEVIRAIVVGLEALCKVKAPAKDYLEALEKAEDEVGAWFSASIDAARDDVRRKEHE